MAKLQRLHLRLAGSPVSSPIAAYVLIAGGVLLGGLVWSQQERTLIPSFKETDVFIELQGSPGVSLQAMERTTGSMIHDLRILPGVRNAAAQIGRALLSHSCHLGKRRSDGGLCSHHGEHSTSR